MDQVIILHASAYQALISEKYFWVPDRIRTRHVLIASEMLQPFELQTSDWQSEGYGFDFDSCEYYNI